MKQAVSLALASLGLVSSASALAQVPSHMDFARHSEVNEVSLSPDGKYIAMAIPGEDGMETQMHIVPLDGSGTMQG